MEKSRIPQDSATAEAWGEDYYDGDASSVNLTNVADVMCGGNTCVALKNDVTAETWGHDSYVGDASSVHLTNSRSLGTRD